MSKVISQRWKTRMPKEADLNPVFRWRQQRNDLHSRICHDFHDLHSRLQCNLITLSNQWTGRLFHFFSHRLVSVNSSHLRLRLEGARNSPTSHIQTIATRKIDVTQHVSDAKRSHGDPKGSEAGTLQFQSRAQSLGQRSCWDKECPADL